MPEEEAPDGSGCVDLVGADGACLGLVPKVEGVGKECGVFEEVETPYPVSGGEAGAGGGAEGATGGAVFTAGGVVPANVVPNGCSFGMEVQLYWNSGAVSSSPVRNL